MWRTQTLNLYKLLVISKLKLMLEIVILDTGCLILNARRFHGEKIMVIDKL